MNKKYTIGDYTNCRYDICMVLCDGEWILTVATKDADKIISLLEENEQLKQQNQELMDYGRELLEYINSPLKYRKSIFNAVVYFKDKKGDVE